MTQQPKWKKVGTIGDINPVDYDGGFVFIDETGVYPPEIEWYERQSEDDDSPITVYRVMCEPHTYVDGILSDNKYHPEHAAWYGSSIEAIAQCTGIERQKLIDMFCSEDPVSRACAYWNVASYYGWNEFDQYPLVLTEAEAKKRVKGKK